MTVESDLKGAPPIPDRTGPDPLLIGFVGSLIAAILLLPALASTGWNPTLLVGFGADAKESLEYAEALLGDVDARAALGHDGKFFFAQAVDPWLSDPETLATVIDFPIYRSQRMFYPMLAGLFGFAPPGLVVWLLVVVNVLASGVGTWAAALVARGMGGSSMWGLAFALNLGVMSEIAVSGAGVVALAAALGAVACFQRGLVAAGAVSLALSALSREVMLLSCVGIAFWLWRRGFRWWAASATAVPGLAVLGWGLYVRARFGWASGVDEVAGMAPPFRGIARSVEAWMNAPFDFFVAGVTLALLAAFTWVALRRDVMVGWMALGFVPLAIVLNELVWLKAFDITRAVAPVITAFVLVAFAARREGQPGSIESNMRSPSS